MIELTASAMAHGGDAVARLDGKAHFVSGALPGERVLAEVVRDAGSWARAEVRSILEPSADRVEPICGQFGACGGCQWQMAEYGAQLAWKREIVAGQLAHLGRVADPVVRPTAAPGPPYGYRTRMDFRVADGRPALYRWRSRDLEPIVDCMLLHPALAGLFHRLGSLVDVRAVTIRSSAATDELLAVVDGVLPDGVEDWGCGVVRRHEGGLRAIIGDGTITEWVAGSRFRITGDAFFQNNPAGAAGLVELVGEALDPGPGDTMLDAYAGGGLFGATVGRRSGRVLAIESHPAAVADLGHNLGGAGVDHLIVTGAVEEAALDLADGWDLAVADPPRTGLGPAGVAAVAAGRPRVIAYVSCDPAALARDVRHLADRGYRLEWAAPVDLFPQTFHIETVAAFRR